MWLCFSSYCKTLSGGNNSKNCKVKIHPQFSKGLPIFDDCSHAPSADSSEHLLVSKGMFENIFVIGFHADDANKQVLHP
jgi:hypothetical protein